MSPSAVGTSVPRKEVDRKLTGEAVYVDDMVLPGMLYGATIRSSVPRGVLKGIHFGGDIPWNEFVVVTAKDIPGKNVCKLLAEDQPFLADERINHPEEPVALIAHSDRHLVQEARRWVRVDIAAEEPCFDLKEALLGQKVVWGRDNILKRILIEKGNVDSVWDGAYRIVEGEYTTGSSEQLYIETQGMVALATPEEGVTVWGSLQCPYYVHPALCQLFGLPPGRVRVIQTETGGAFGGKEEYPSMVAGHAALLAWKSGKPVKLVYDREEDLAATPKRHPSWTRHRTAVDEDGRLLAMDIEFVLDGGAYLTLSPVVLSRGSIHAAGPYRCPNVRIRSSAVATNSIPQGAYRGFGNPQSFFALERHLDRVARELGLPPEEFRRRNFLQDGDTTATGQVVRDGVDMSALLDRALTESDFLEKQKRYREWNAQGGPIRRGMGLAAFMHGSGFTGGGETRMRSVAGVEGTAEGGVRILSASTEMGQGTNTIFSQIVADALELPYAMIEVAQPDTAHVPNSGPTVASRTCMVVGKLLETAAVSLKQTLVQSRFLSEIYTPDEFRHAMIAYLKKHGQLRSYSQYHKPPHIQWSDETYRGDAYVTYAWAIYVADVSLDTRTYEARVHDFVALQEIGKVVHPVLAEGQVEGGVAQGVGFALSEEIVWKDGRMVNNQMTNYIMPTAVDLPIIRALFQEVPYAGGPVGAKGVGELPIDGPAPAILNALEEATGVSIHRIPATPEIIMEEMEKAGA